IFDRVIHALDVHVFGLCCRNLEIHSPERPEFRHNLEDEGKNTRPKPRLAIDRPPLAFIPSAIQIIEKFLLVKIGILSNQLIVTRKQCNPRHLWNEFADAAAVAADCHVYIPKNVLELQIIGLKESAFQQWPRNLESNEVVITVGGVAVLRHLDHVNSEFSANM